jgi:CRP-like cAMP-binding protein
MGEEALAILAPGAVFGEMAVLERARRSADAVAHEDVEALVLDADAFENMLFVDKELAYYVLRAMTRTLAGRLRDTTEKLMTVFVMAQFC